jgi:hypothetical protein
MANKSIRKKKTKKCNQTNEKGNRQDLEVIIIAFQSCASYEDARKRSKMGLSSINGECHIGKGA